MTNGKMLRRTNNRTTRSLLLMLLAALISASCNGQDDLTPDDAMKMALSEFPSVDCSTSTQPLSVILAAKVMGVPYKWYKNETLTQVWYVSIDWDKTSFTQTQREELEGKLNCSTTHGSYTNLIDGKVELIIASRDISRTEQKYADGKGVKLITRPVGKDGFVFIVNKANREAAG
jgi:phosphate transport system substrate-binding protein